MDRSFSLSHFVKSEYLSRPSSRQGCIGALSVLVGATLGAVSPVKTRGPVAANS